MPQIPEKHLPFSEKTLMVCLSEFSGKPYVVFERTMTELNPIESPEIQYHYTDREGFSFSPSGSSTAVGTETHNFEHYEKTYFNFFVTELKKLDQKEHFESFIFFVPKKMHKMLHGKLPKEMVQKAKFISGSFSNMHPLELIEKLEKDERDAYEGK